jgi:ribosomal protein S18 acetylase RimI-like enzyme
VNWQLRRASDDDRDYLYRLHVLTMRDVIEATWGWNEEWQRGDFAKRFAESQYFVIEADGTSIGTLCVERRPGAIYILELQLLPEYQGAGIGTEVIHGVIRDAALEGLPVALSVADANQRARRLYERLGFEVTGIDPPFIRMARHSTSD